MSTVVSGRVAPVALRAGISVTLAVSGLLHASLYLDGYRFIPVVGPAFLLQGSAFVALAVLIVLGGPRWLTWAAGVGALGSLVAFALSRTVGIFGFVEHGWDPAPQAVLSVVFESLTVVFVIVSVMTNSRGV